LFTTTAVPDQREGAAYSESEKRPGIHGGNETPDGAIERLAVRVR
jgi:hypothetical protein